MKAFFKGVGILILLTIVFSFLAAASKEAALLASLALIAFPAIALFRPIPKLHLGHRGFSLAVLLLVGLPAFLITSADLDNQREEEFAKLKETDTRAYLEALKDYSQDRWLTELSVIDPEQYQTEIDRLEAEAAQKAEEERLRAEAEMEAKRAKDCGADNAVMAYIMSQTFVKRVLKAPATAEFPRRSEVISQAIGDCKFQVIGHVDAQNSFGALIRSRYTAELQYFPEEGSWRALDVNLFD